MKRAYNIATSAAASIVRGMNGIHVVKGVEGFKRPEKLITLYVKEACPFTRKVREGFSMLDIDMQAKPCPIDGTRFRPELKKEGGQEQVPFMIDPNTNTKMYESQKILDYMFDTYGPGKDKIPFLMRDGFVPTGSSRLATIFRSLPWHGLIQYKGDDATSMATLIPKKVSTAPHDVTPEHPPVPKPLRLYNYEGSGNCRLVREALDTLEIPYIVHNVAKGSPRRKDFVEMSGKMQVPYLVDENTGKKMFESEDIKQYLYDTYRPVKK